ncbi:hypothetical protein SAMN05421759_11056 [Roseivivax lentus]|uniref:Phage tail protein (Tail_P2_I) n=1 Tax=Roseivivax lentus TaxID=633194 RepID=A0A1N7NU57_9RHOB|nr:hypothetical protein [Roseivivax lentus]SIT01806.1 hypothetical protein SAMN05421759_11056 [Roseivivax lentus]
MTRFATDDLFQLLPAYLRVRDAEEGARVKGRVAPGDARDIEDFGPLRTLASLIAREAQIVDESLDDLYDNAFIETCAPWVIPYIGDLLGMRGLEDIPEGIDMRARVADALALRARKGTLRALEHASGTASNWPVYAAEYWNRLVHAQSMRLLHPDFGGSVDMRDRAALARIGTAFERNSRNVEVRRIETAGGQWNRGNIGIHIWRLRPYSISGHPATQAPGDRRFRFHPLGCDAQLFDRAHDRPLIDTPVTEDVLPSPIARWIMDEAPGTFYGQNRAMMLMLDGTEVPVEQICVAHLGDEPGGGAEPPWNHPPRDDRIMIDPELGRIVLRTGDPANPDLRVTCHFARPLEIGGGEHGSRDLDDLSAGTVIAPGGPPVSTAINAAGGQGLFVLDATDIYTAGGTITVPAGGALRLVAATQHFPTLRLTSELDFALGDGATLELNGLRIFNAPVRISGTGETATIADTTLVPGRRLNRLGAPEQPNAAALFVDAVGITLDMARVITGPVRLEAEVDACFAETIIDAMRPQNRAIFLNGAPLRQVIRLDRCTVHGRVETDAFGEGDRRPIGGLGAVSEDDPEARLATSDTLFVSDTVPAVRAERRQVGCIRFSHVPPDSVTPRLYRCTEGPAPVFDSLRYADPDYMLLRVQTGDHILRGAENRGEIGAYNRAAHTVRRDNIRRSIDDFLRFGHAAGLFCST